MSWRPRHSHVFPDYQPRLQHRRDRVVHRRDVSYAAAILPARAGRERGRSGRLAAHRIVPRLPPSGFVKGRSRCGTPLGSSNPRLDAVTDEPNAPGPRRGGPAGWSASRKIHPASRVADGDDARSSGKTCRPPEVTWWARVRRRCAVARVPGQRWQSLHQYAIAQRRAAHADSCKADQIPPDRPGVLAVRLTGRARICGLAGKFTVACVRNSLGRGRVVTVDAPVSTRPDIVGATQIARRSAGERAGRTDPGGHRLPGWG